MERKWTCSHTVSQRCLTGTWCTPKLQEAINCGYRIQQVHKIWHFPCHSVHLFQSYVNTLKIKQASGWPAWVGDNHNKQAQYGSDYQRTEGVTLHPVTSVTIQGGILSANSCSIPFGENMVSNPARVR